MIKDVHGSHRVVQSDDHERTGGSAEHRIQMQRFKLSSPMCQLQGCQDSGKQHLELVTVNQY
jgi:hypothetical protein